MTRAVALAHIPPKLFKLSPHLSLRLAQIPGGSWQNPTLQIHLLASTTRIVRRFVLFDITANLGDQRPSPAK